MGIKGLTRVKSQNAQTPAGIKPMTALLYSENIITHGAAVKTVDADYSTLRPTLHQRTRCAACDVAFAYEIHLAKLVHNMCLAFSALSYDIGLCTKFHEKLKAISGKIGCPRSVSVRSATSGQV